jgi:hypothetical protein
MEIQWLWASVIIESINVLFKLSSCLEGRQIERTVPQELQLSWEEQNMEINNRCGQIYIQT